MFGYAYLLHIICSLKSTGKGACILPHGVLFRGNAEGEIRRKLVRKGYIRAIIGLPANLFYGTGIPACIVVLDKEEAHARKGIFMIDASQGFIKDGPKNRLPSRSPGASKSRLRWLRNPDLNLRRTRHGSPFYRTNSLLLFPTSLQGPQKFPASLCGESEKKDNRISPLKRTQGLNSALIHENSL